MRLIALIRSSAKVLILFDVFYLSVKGVTPVKFQASQRAANMTYSIRDVVAEAKKLESTGKKIHWMNIGDPLKYDFRTPEHLWDAVNAHRESGESYSSSQGIVEARQAVADYYQKLGVDVEKENVLIGNGLSEIVWFGIGALANPGENILLPSPTYPLYSSAAKYLLVETRYYSLDEEKEWEPDCDEIRANINEKTKAIVVINPNNPTGANYSKSTLKEIVGIAGEHNIVVLADEIYSMERFTKKPHVPLASLGSDVPVLSMNGLSKNFFATGFRVGWIAANNYMAENSDLLDAINKLGRARLCSVHPFQYCVKAALEGPMDFLKEYTKKIGERQIYANKRLNEIEGLSCVKPEASFYAFPRIELDIKSDKEFVMELLRETGVCTVFGEGFGQKKGTHHFRIVTLPTVPELTEAFDKIEGFVKKNYL